MLSSKSLADIIHLIQRLVNQDQAFWNLGESLGYSRDELRTVLEHFKNDTHRASLKIVQKWRKNQGAQIDHVRPIIYEILAELELVDTINDLLTEAAKNTTTESAATEDGTRREVGRTAAASSTSFPSTEGSTPPLVVAEPGGLAPNTSSSLTIPSEEGATQHATTAVKEPRVLKDHGLPRETLKLFDYQRKLAKPALRGLNAVIVAPEGSGKTFLAVAVARKVLRKSKGRGKVVHVVNRVSLVQQRCAVYQRFVELVVGLCSGDPGTGQPPASAATPHRQPLNVLLASHSVVVLTAQILARALAQGQVHLNDLGLIVLEGCHETKKDSPYNDIMRRYLLEGREEDEAEDQQLPQILGLTDSLGCGGARSLQATVYHALKMCANMDVVKVTTISDTSLAASTQEADIAAGRQTDPFAKEIKDLMTTILLSIQAAAKNDQAIIDSVIELGKLVCEEPLLDKLNHALCRLNHHMSVSLHQTMAEKLCLTTYTKHLKEYASCLAVNQAIRPQDALSRLQTFVDQERTRGARQRTNITDMKLLSLFDDALPQLKDICQNTENQNPALNQLQQTLEDALVLPSSQSDSGLSSDPSHCSQSTSKPDDGASVGSVSDPESSSNTGVGAGPSSCDEPTSSDGPDRSKTNDDATYISEHSCDSSSDPRSDSLPNPGSSPEPTSGGPGSLRGILFTQTIACARALKSWVEETESLKQFNPEVLVGKRNTGNTEPHHNDVLGKWQKGVHILLITTCQDLSPAMLAPGTRVRVFHYNCVSRSEGQAARESHSDQEWRHERALYQHSRLQQRERLATRQEGWMQQTTRALATLSVREMDLIITGLQKRNSHRLDDIADEKSKDFGHRFICKTCGVMACQSANIRIIPGGHRVIVDRNVLSKVEIKAEGEDVEPRQRKQFGGVEVTENEIWCKGCNNKWGSVLLCAEGALLSICIKAFTVLPAGAEGTKTERARRVGAVSKGPAKPRGCRKWGALPFTFREDTAANCAFRWQEISCGSTVNASTAAATAIPCTSLHQ